MKIAYLTNVNLHSDTGVRKKHLMQGTAWRDLGHDVCFFSSRKRLKGDNLVGFSLPLKEYSIKNTALHNKFPRVSKFWRSVSAVSRVKKDLNRFNPDIVYMRSMIWYPGLINILKGHTVVWEGNTLIENELKVLDSGLSRILNKIGELNIYKHLSGVVGVTEEITTHYKAYSSKLEGVTIGNGYLLEAELNKYRSAQNNTKPQIIFVGSPGKPWHGIDNFLTMAGVLKEYDFHLVGPEINDSIQLSNLKQHGYLNKEKLYQLYQKMDIAVGSLALYRNGMSEGSTLKVKEYAAFGLPIIINHKDVDLQGQEFVLELPSVKGSIKNNISIIREFIERWRGKRIDLDKVHHLIDYNIKERKRINFFLELTEIPSIH
jgi:hypothetical protein